MTPHQRYEAMMKELGLQPTLDEKELHKAWGIVEKEEYTPFIAKRSAGRINAKPTLDNHIVINGKKIAS